MNYKAPKTSVRDRLRSVREKQERAAHDNRQLWRLLLAILTEAEGKVEISKEALEKPNYASFHLNFNKDLITLTGVEAPKK